MQINNLINLCNIKLTLNQVVIDWLFVIAIGCYLEFLAVTHLYASLTH